MQKYASLEVSEVLELKGTKTRQHTASLDKAADYDNYRTGDGYLYARIRAISSRVNRNHDGWPSIELAGSPEIFEHHHSAGGFTVEASEGNKNSGFATFIGKPIFVDHHNSNPKKARGVIVDAKLNVLDHKTAASEDSYWGGSDVDSEHLPPTEVELLLEVDAQSFPRLAQAIVSGDLDGFSMGCDVDYSKCSHCGHVASSPDEYCSHIVMKGAHHDYKTADGKRTSRKSYENCYGIKFFEISAVFEPADETALAREVRSAVYKEADDAFVPAVGQMGVADQRDPLLPYQQEVSDLAMQYQLKGVDQQTSMDMARRKVQQTNGLGGGEGYRTPHEMGDMPQHGQLPQWRMDPMPKGDPNQFAMPEGWDPTMSSFKQAENPLPQEMHTRAPDELDTLRDERLCPVCGNDMQGETCQVCGYVEPPKEFDNPDLEKAQQIRQEMKDSEEQQATQPQTAQQPGGQPQQGGPNQTPAAGGPPGASKAPATAGLKGDMHNWTPKVHPRTAARINQVERPVNASTTPATNEPKTETVTKDQTRPVTSAMATARELMASAQQHHTGDTMNTRTADGPTPPGDTSPKTRVDVEGVGGVDEASNDAASKADAQVDVTGIGGTGVSDVEADSKESLPTASEKSDDSGFNTDKTTEDSGPTKTYGDSDGSASGVGEPVTSEKPYWIDESKWSNRRNAYEDGTLEQQEQQGDPVAQGGSAVKGVQPIAESFGDRVNVLEHKTSPSNNSGPTTTWTGTDGNGVLKQQEPVTKEDQEWGGVKVPDVEFHTPPVKSSGKISFAAIRLAEMEAELGLITREARFNRMIELDREEPGKVSAQIETLSRVKTAGLAKLAAHRQAGVTRLPSAFGKHTAAPNGFQRIANDHESSEQTPVDNEALDAGLFLR